MGITKASVKLAGQILAADSAIAWKFMTGTQPFTAVYSVPNSTWDRTLKNKVGVPLTLEIIDANGIETKIRQVYILHKTSSAKPSVTSFMVADRRWRWNRKLIAREYNIARKTGDKNFDRQTLPVEARVTTDAYDYQPYSLVNGDRTWTPKEAVEDALSHLEEPEDIDASELIVRAQFTLQNVTLRDPGDIALARLLSFIPGADVWIDRRGKVKIIDALDVAAAERQVKRLPPATWDGDKVEKIDRKKIRPKAVHVFYEREVEVVLEYSDKLIGGQPDFDRNRFYVENVIPTTDPVTSIREYDAEVDAVVDKLVPPGTWVSAPAWLEAMDKVKPDGAAAWDFETVRLAWLVGDLEGMLVGSDLRGADVIDTTNVMSAIRALRQNFRQTFRINRRAMSRIQDIRGIRVALLDPVTGARMPASVWGQMCVAPTRKGIHIAARRDPGKASMYYNIDNLPEAGAADRLVDRAPGPMTLTFVDADAGIFRLETLDDAYGTYSALLPCHVINRGTGGTSAPTRNLARQDDEPIGAGMRLTSGTNEIILSNTMRFKAIVTLTPGSPNSKAAFHVEKVPTSEIAAQFGGKFAIEEGQGPPIEVFVPSSEATARFAWSEDVAAADTLAQLLGLNHEDPTKGGIVDDPATGDINEAGELPGYVFVNEDREIESHSRSMAAEVISPYADSVQGRISTRVPDKPLDLQGNQSGATISVSAAPSGKVSAIHEFPGQIPPVSRLALMSEGARKVVLGIVRFR